MISAGQFRNGITFEREGDIYQVIEFQHVKPGKGAAFVRAKIRNILTGAIKDETFNPTERFQKAHIETKDMEYIYNDGELFYFMDPETYEQLPVDGKVLEDTMKYIKENDKVTLAFYKGQIISVTPPNFVELKVTMTEPGVKGDTSSGATKPATVETGLTVYVPLFVEIGDVLRIDTRTGEYESRA
ncbi:MAG TPA: elongation factor P [Tissierellaceae bacterium]